jgi:alpha-amylase
LAKYLVIYTVVHQPHRLKLPAQPIPAGALPEDIARCLFDRAMDRRYLAQVAAKCYWPASALFRELVGEGLKLNIGFSESVLEQLAAWEPALLQSFRELVRQPGVELIGVEPEHSFIFYLDIERFIRGMQAYRQRLEEGFGRPVRVTDTTEMFMSNDLYFALARAGFRGGLLDGRPWVLEWRRSTYLYHHGLPLYLLCRHTDLSDDVGYRFSDRSWSGWPLLASTYADWIAAAPGDFVVVGWDFETFGEHHWADSGIFDFLRALPGELRRRGVECLGASEAIDRFAERSYDLPLPAFPATWAGDGGVGFFLGNPVQQALFQLMHHAYNKALLTEDPRLVDLAVKLTQSDVLHLTQWFGRSGDQAAVSAYFTPREWWSLGPAGIVWEVQQVYKNFIRALDPHAAAAVRRRREAERPAGAAADAEAGA